MAGAGAGAEAEAGARVQCPVCALELPASHINAHLDGCLQGAGPEPSCKKPRLAGAGPAGSPGPAAVSRDSLAQKLEGKPLADKLRPGSLDEYVGQDQVVGEDTLLRSLLESREVPSLILWGPPGCGKVSAGLSPLRLYGYVCVYVGVLGVAVLG